MGSLPQPTRVGERAWVSGLAEVLAARAGCSARRTRGRGGGGCRVGSECSCASRIPNSLAESRIEATLRGNPPSNQSWEVTVTPTHDSDIAITTRHRRRRCRPGRRSIARSAAVRGLDGFVVEGRAYLVRSSTGYRACAPDAGRVRSRPPTAHVGTPKTRTAVALVKRWFEAGVVTRVGLHLDPASAGDRRSDQGQEDRH